MSKFKCVKVRTAVGAFTDPKDKMSRPCRAFQVQFFNVEEQQGPQWGVADIMMTILHECHYVEGQVYDGDTLLG